MEATKEDFKKEKARYEKLELEFRLNDKGYHTLKMMEKYEHLILFGVSRKLPTDKKLFSMADKITNAIQNALAENLILDKQQFEDLSEEWFDWLKDEVER